MAEQIEDHSSRCLFEHALNDALADLDRVLYVEEGNVIRGRDLCVTLADIENKISTDEEQGVIGCSLHSSSLILCCLLASWRVGRIPLLLDPSLRDELASLSQANGMRTIFSDSPLALPHHFISLQPCQNVSECPRSPHIVVPEDEEPAVAFLTSGSEGTGKLVFKRGRQIYEELVVLRSFFVIKDDARFLSFVPPYHIYGFLMGELLPILCRGHAYIQTEPILIAIDQEIERVKPAIIAGSPLHYKALLRGGHSLGKSTTEIYLSSGAPLSPEVSYEFLQMTGNVIHQVYGSTETGGIASRIHDHLWHPLPGVSVTIDPDESIIEVQSPWASNQGPMHRERTMDAGELVDDGFKLLGRAATLLKFRGKRFSTLEVEQMMRTFPGVDDAVVFAVTIEDVDFLVAFFTSVENATFNERDIRKYLKLHLASFKIPRYISDLPSLPRIKLGKVDYSELRRLALELFSDDFFRNHERTSDGNSRENIETA